MAHHLYRLATLICCDTCGLEWFGAMGESEARNHALKTHHQVRINSLVRETLNLVTDGQLPTYESPLDRAPAEQKKSRAAAIARLESLYRLTP